MAVEVNKELEAIRAQEAEQKKRRAEMEKAAYEGGHVSFGRAFGDGAASTGEWLVKNAPDSFKSNVANAKEQLGKGNYGAGLASAGSVKVFKSIRRSFGYRISHRFGRSSRYGARKHFGKR